MATWDVASPNRLEVTKVCFDNIISAMLSVECMIDSILSAMPLIFTLLKVSTKRTAKKCPNARKGTFFKGSVLGRT